MLDKIAELFLASCPEIITSRGHIKAVLEGATLFTRENEGELIAAAAVKNNSIALLCVHPSHRLKGIGRALFAECEKYVKSKGFDKIKMFGLEPYVTPGAPLFDGNRELFERLGYVHTWGDDECVDMITDFSNTDCLKLHIGDTVNGITYRFATHADKPAVLDCVKDAHDHFTPYYSSDELYNPDNDEHILIALDGDLVCGSLLVECYDKARGSVGCTNTRHAYRGRGVATNMVKVATRYLYDEGFKSSWLGFTFTGIIPMYGKSGYKVFMKYFMGEKAL